MLFCLQNPSKSTHASKCTEILAAMMRDNDWPFPQKQLHAKSTHRHCKFKGFCSATENVKVVVST